MVIFLRLVAVVGIISLLQNVKTNSPVTIIVGLVAMVLLFVLAPRIFKKKPRKSKSESNKSVHASAKFEPAPAPAPAVKVEKFNVAGLSYHMGEFMQLAIEVPDYTTKKSEIIDSCLEDQRIYKYYFSPDVVELIPEPDNEHDSNAVAVYADGLHIGYIKAGSCSRVKNLLSSGLVDNIRLEAWGGPYVYYDSYNETLDRDEAIYGAKVLIYITE